ncbi:Pleckstrin homology domain-containing protein [Hygrophoropsis aurantiaca]|uniref:Pleckstrin homology domain-containing protein n=1 Tax=Hygrophoropsis aurantiaca TaxID=72124 RepID=A0ACB8AJ72_9AGAM|nr:Pleckstrin homology domain-containing protein [Hygrophoropsis aurantiaca]
MPEKVLSQTDSQTGNKKRNTKTTGWMHLMDSGAREHSESNNSMLSRAIDGHAYHFFLRRGGHARDWDDNAKENTREEMLQIWRNSEWGGLLKRRRNEGSSVSRHWVGGSFEVGTVLGVNIINHVSGGSQRDQNAITSNTTNRALQTKTDNAASPDVRPPSVTPSDRSSQGSRSRNSFEAYPGAASASDTNHGSFGGVHSSSSALLTSGGSPALFDTNEGNTGKDLLNSTPSGSDPLPDTSHVDNNPTRNSQSVAQMTLKSKPSNLLAQSKRKGKNVHYPDSNPVVQPPRELEGESPVPPFEVLTRSGSIVDETSAGATIDPVRRGPSTGDIVLRDRMLVRVSYTKSESLSTGFDETQNRTTPDLQYEDWAEFLVVWKKDKVEMYEDYIFPGKEFLTGHKHLAFLIPLESPNTRLSLYSFVDLTFCITCPPTPVRSSESKARAILHRAKEGTNVFIFKHKSRTRAMDWVWQLWRRLGNQIPSTIEIRCPNIEARFKIDIPIIDVVNVEKAYTMFSRSNIINLIHKSLDSAHHSGNAASRDWKHVMEPEIARGKALKLAWRMDTKLDWIWQEEDIEGNRRPWAILYGLVLKQARKSSHLELRLAEHLPSTIHVPGGTKLYEPPAIEGYLDRIKPNTQSKQPVYLSTHDGNLFSISPSDAHPPTPPNVHLSHGIPENQTDRTDTTTLHNNEIRRGATQITTAQGVLDVRNIAFVRRASDLVPQYQINVAKEDGGDADQDAIVDVDDEGDEGGLDGMMKAKNKVTLRIQRSFEIILNSGLVLRYEAYSCQTSIEWINKLRALVIYWKYRHRIDTQDEMELAYSTSHRSRPTPHINKYGHAGGHEIPPEPSVDSESSLPALGSLYHWCILAGCRSIIRSGRVFVKKGLRGRYKLVQLHLVSGHLVQYHISPKSTLHHRRSKEISLVDAYICSGYLAALSLRGGEYIADSANAPRRYEDGLEADDPEEDMLFIIRYRKNKHPAASSSMTNVNTNGVGSIPPLSSKHKIVVFRARSKIERDVWCWALSCEIEKLVRSNRDREEKLRGTGGWVNNVQS